MTGKTFQQSKKDLFYQALTSKILTMKLLPGSDLDEVRLSEEYGLSRTPVRDIFWLMTGEGYVDIVGNRGASVTHMNHKTLKEFVQAAHLIYVSVARLAVRNVTPAQLGALKSIQSQFKQSAVKQNVDEMIINDDRFHSKLGEMADNQYLVACLRRLLTDHARIAHIFFNRTNINAQKLVADAIEHHDQLIQAIEGGHEQQAVNVALEHWELARIQLEHIQNPNPIPLGLMAGNFRDACSK